MITPDIIVAAGFKPPTVQFSKPDPRGQEYGKFTAEIVKPLLPSPQLIVEVSHVDAGGKETYRMYFTSAEHFSAWASDQT